MPLKLDEDNKIQQTISLYHQFGWKKYFARLRFWYAPFVEIEKMLPEKGTILDLGCAEGIFTSYAALSSDSRQVIGIEIDENRILQAPQKIPNLNFQKGDITKIELPKSDAIVIFHVLHHLPSYEAQIDVLRKCHESLTSKGRLIIVEVNVKLSIKYLLTWFTDRILVGWVFEKNLYAKILFRKRSAWENLLNSLGFTVKTIPSEKRGPFANVIFSCSLSAK